nr:hypothetical protein [Rhodococcus rhodochrous]
MKAGTRLHSSVCDTSVVIVRPADGVALECGGHPMSETADSPRIEADLNASTGTVMGKRYEDAETGLEVLCVKAGAGSLSIAGRPLSFKEAKTLPSSD